MPRQLKTGLLLLITAVLLLGLCGGAYSVGLDARKDAPSTKAASAGPKADKGGDNFLASLNTDAEKRPVESREESPIVTALSFISKLILVLGLAYVTILGLKKVTGMKSAAGASHSCIRVVENSSLGANRTLHLVEVGSKKLLVASTPSQITLITELAAEDVPSSTDCVEQAKGFKEQLAGFLGTKPGSGEAAKKVAQMLRESTSFFQGKTRDVGELRKKFRETTDG